MGSFPGGLSQTLHLHQNLLHSFSYAHGLRRAQHLRPRSRRVVPTWVEACSIFPRLMAPHPLGLSHPQATLHPSDPCPSRRYKARSTRRQGCNRVGKGLSSSRLGAIRCLGRRSSTMEASRRRPGSPCIRRRRRCSMERCSMQAWPGEGAGIMGEGGHTRV